MMFMQFFDNVLFIKIARYFYRFFFGFVWFGNCVVCRFGYFDYFTDFFFSFSHVQEILRKKDTKRNGPGSWLLTCPNHQRRRPFHPPLLVSFQPSEI
jgi:hypothetical protein